MLSRTIRCLPLLLGLVSIVAEAGVAGIEIVERAPVLNGAEFGDVGAYEKLSGRIHFAFDPDNPANRGIVDLGSVPLDESGHVEAVADFMVLRPVTSQDRSVGLLEVSNRGSKASLRYFNAGARGGNDPTTAEHFGDGLLMRRGLTLIWVGWQSDVPQEPELLRLRLPIARAGAAPITGLARSDWVVDEAAVTLGLGHRNHVPYPPAEGTDERNVLTVRTGRNAKRSVVPRDAWRFVKIQSDEAGSDYDGIALEGGFEAGRIYELVYVARDPRPVGIGLAVIRDTMAYALHGEDSPFAVEHGIAFGVSQTGRFLRQFLYQGFNGDESGRRVFDGMLIHTAGAGRGSFNHRFGQPSRDAHRYSAFFYPTDLYPFSSLAERDPGTGREEGLLDGLAPPLRPRVMVTNTGYEYWGRAASLIHAGLDGRGDLPLPPTERIYHLAGGQHFVDAWPPLESRRLPDADGWVGNPVDFLVNLRALVVGLADWVAEDRAPPASRYPRVARGELVAVDAYEFPDIAGVATPEKAHVAYRADYGPRWPLGIVDRQPPILGAPFVSLVPALDAAGNERGGVRNVELRVPLATYTAWSLRLGLANPGELTDFRGMLLPLPLDSAASRGDPRPTIASLYPDRETYRREAAAAADALITEGFLLEEDRPRVLRRADALWDLLVTARTKQ